MNKKSFHLLSFKLDPQVQKALAGLIQFVIMSNFKHRYYGTPTYKNWSEMLYRCRCVGKKYWKDKGITVCKRWNKFENFIKDMGERPEGKNSIDRIDNNKGYFPGNCRWATNKEQCRNKSNNFLLKGKTLSEWSELLGIKRSTLAQRHYTYKWSEDRVLSK